MNGVYIVEGWEDLWLWGVCVVGELWCPGESVRWEAMGTWLVICSHEVMRVVSGFKMNRGYIETGTDVSEVS